MSDKRIVSIQLTKTKSVVAVEIAVFNYAFLQNGQNLGMNRLIMTRWNSAPRLEQSL